MRRAYSYLRFSTPEQAKGDSYRRQSEMAREYAARNDLALDETLTFQDLGVSAFRGANAGEAGKLGQFKAAVEAGLVPSGSVLLVESLDRISRQAARRALRVLEDVVDAGVSVVTLSDRREYDREALDRDPGALLMALLIFIRANEESEMKSQRLKASWRSKRAKASSKPMTARGPAWLRLADDRTGWHVIEDRAAVVRRIFTLAANGVGENAIASALNADGIATWGDNGRAPAVMWHKSYVSKILLSRAVVGTLVPCSMVHEGGRKTRTEGVPVEGYYPTVISPELWGAVRAIKDTINPARGRHAASAVQNVLGGLARCSVCGATMTRVMKGSGGHAGPPKLVCVGAKTGKGCDYRPVPMDDVERALISGLDGILAGGPVAEQAEVIQRQLGHHRERAAMIQAVIDRIIDGDDLVTKGNAGWEVLNAKYEQKAEVDRTIARLKSEADMVHGPVLQSRISELREALNQPELDRARINVAMRHIFSGVVVNVERQAMALTWKAGGESVAPLPITTTSQRLARHAASMGRDKAGRYLDAA